MTKAIAIIIPAHNESKRIGEVLESLGRYKDDIIVVNDGSTDGTNAIVNRYGVTLLNHVVNLGKGAAMTTGAEYALTRGYWAVLFMDADGQHSPADIPKFRKALESSDCVFGNRILSTKNSIVRVLGNKLDETLIHLLYKTHIKDPLCGYRALRLSAYEKLRWVSQGYAVETEMVINAIKRDVTFTQVEVETRYLDYYKGVSILSAWKIILDVIKWRLRP